MADGISAEVVVTRKVREGWYVYTCKELPGLFVASQDDEVAYNDVPKSIHLLLQLDYGIDCVVSHKVEYDEFLRQMSLADQAREAVNARTAELMGGGEQYIPFTLQSCHRDGAPA